MSYRLSASDGSWGLSMPAGLDIAGAGVSAVVLSDYVNHISCSFRNFPIHFLLRTLLEQAAIRENVPTRIVS